MAKNSDVTRRDFLKLSVSSAGLLFSGIQLPLAFAGENSDGKDKLAEFKLLTLHHDNTLTIYNSRSEMGQGVMTSLSQLLLEELDADWSQIREVKQSWADGERFGHQNTIGAISSLIGWNSHRQAGGKINLLLREAAALHWDSPLDQVKTHKGKISHLTSGETLTYGDLVGKIDPTKLVDKIPLKAASEFHLIGKSMPRLDLQEKIQGTAAYGIDQQLENLKTAVVVRCPVFGGSVKSFSPEAALKIKGVQKVFAVPSGIAIVADNYWQATKARQKLAVQWESGAFADTSDASLQAQFKQQLQSPGKKVADIGKAEETLLDLPYLESEFEFPLVAHMTMEPMNCTVWFKKSRCEIWAPTQNPQDAQTSAAKTLGLEKSFVKVNTTYMGGGFGRRAQDDFVIEACEVARQVPYPVKVIWSREDDIQHDYYRPTNRQVIKASLQDGKIYAWQHKVAALSTSDYHFSLQDRGKDDGDWVAYGGAEKTLYGMPHFQTQIHLTKTPMPVGILRGISHGYVNFAAEVMVDRLAEEAGQDPITFRLSHIEEKRAKAVLTLLSEKLAALKLKNNQALGVAFAHEKAPQGPYQYYNAAAAIIEKTTHGPVINKVILALDHGQVINPDGLLAQAQGSVMYAISMMFKHAITLKKGQIQQSNFHDYPVARMADTVDVEIHTVETEDWPMGTGEKLQGTIQPAIANALYRATGKRITQLPIDLSTLEA